MKGDIQNVREALARTVASKGVPDEVVSAVAKKLVTDGTKIRKIDICAYGICVDHFIDHAKGWADISQLLNHEFGRVRQVKVFPWGTLDPDMLQVHIEHEFEELAPYLGHP